jgi:hypothetical protein
LSGRFQELTERIKEDLAKSREQGKHAAEALKMAMDRKQDLSSAGQSTDDLEATVRGGLAFIGVFDALASGMTQMHLRMLARIVAGARFFATTVQFLNLAVGTIVWGFGDIVYLHRQEGWGIIYQLASFGAVPH